MNKAIDIIHDEHMALAAVLNALGVLTSKLENEEIEPDFSLFGAMIEYIVEVPEKVHHPKENQYLFAHLRQRCVEAWPIIDALEIEHRQGAERVSELQVALKNYELEGRSALKKFAKIVREYTKLELRHMGTEEGKIIPLAREKLTPEDWDSIAFAFTANGSPWEDETGKYNRLFTKIVSVVPPPLGVGPEIKSTQRK